MCCAKAMGWECGSESIDGNKLGWVCVFGWYACGLVMFLSGIVLESESALGGVEWLRFRIRRHKVVWALKFILS